MKKHFLILAAACLALSAQNLSAQKKVIIGYAGGFRGLINMSLINPQKVTHINYAFVDIKDGKAWLHRELTDTVNFRHLNELKKQNPALKILISIGGWAWSKNFSDAVLTDSSRQVFAASAVAIVQKYHMDGIDIDWEYPGRPGLEGNVYRPEDKENYTLMFKEIRRQLDKLQQQTHKTYLVTTAAGAFKNFVEHTDMGEAQKYLDYINLMTYDYSNGGKVATNHTNLYHSKYYQSGNSADSAVIQFMAAGVPANKLVMGVAFYGRSSILKPGSKTIGDSIASTVRGYGYTTLKDSILKLTNFKAYRDKSAKAPYIFNTETLQFISYDDEWSVKEKCKYVLDKKMAGVMFWEYYNDPKDYLLDEMNKVLK
jgi:chitinase